LGFTLVAGLSLNNLKPRVWERDSPYYLPDLKAVMISYAELTKQHALRRKAMEQGLHEALKIPKRIKIHLDNGAFYFLSKGGGQMPGPEYEQFVREARPDWYTIPRDYIPAPKMSEREQLDCLRRTMEVNRTYSHDGYVPIIHIGRHVDEYLRQIRADRRLRMKRSLALGGIVPNLLRTPKAMTYEKVLADIKRVRSELRNRHLHVFGIGGTATLHIAILFEVDSVDSAGWRNRAARGIVQLPGRGDRKVADLGSWLGREPSHKEWRELEDCRCPACFNFGLKGLRATKIEGFCNRAAHNLWVLFREAEEIQVRLADNTYSEWYESHLDNSIYLSLIRHTFTTTDYIKPGVEAADKRRRTRII
jgi:hypothetical protein